MNRSSPRHVDSAAQLWERQAQQFARIERPLRPSEDDLVWVQESIDRWAAEHARPPAALILGVTPELVARRWPAQATVLATDLSMSMIKGVWPGGKSTAVRQLVVQANWLTLPLAGGSCDLVFGDACFATVHRAQAREVAESIRRVLRSGGAFTTRMFVRPDIAEQPDDVWEQLVEGRIGNFAIFKLRLLMALCSDAGEVGVAEAWIYFRSRCPELPRLAEHLGWPVETVKTIEAYRDQSAIYWFPTVSEFRAVLANLFRERACRSPTYELGERCLTFVLAG